ncbi:hypothetical protein [Skermanella pratensis]|uniref:hypothetical protein n=1 Tax=Skermanella pratensis TaxID=2233999 RepID=UPI0013017690|nr:hypothetical protein [Skermanella pratensis]
MKWAYALACAATGVARDNRARVVELSARKEELQKKWSQTAIDSTVTLLNLPNAGRTAGFCRIMGVKPAFSSVVALEAFARISQGLEVAERQRLDGTMLAFAGAMMVYHVAQVWQALSTNTDNEPTMQRLGLGTASAELVYKLVWKTETDWLLRTLLGLGRLPDPPEAVDRRGISAVRTHAELRAASRQSTLPRRLAELESLSADCWHFLISARKWTTANIDLVPAALC